MKITITALLFFSCMHFDLHAQTTPAHVALTEKLNALLGQWNVPGFSVSVIKGNQQVFNKAFGYRDREKKLPVTTGTAFPIGSCTKGFTATLLAMYASEKNIDIDRPIADQMQLPDFFPSALKGQVTFSDILTHRTGLPRYDLSWYVFPSSSRDSLALRVKYMQPTAPFRMRWDYNNYMYLLAGLFAEKIAGDSWENILKQRLLSPLGMLNTYADLSEMRTAGNYALGYRQSANNITQRSDFYPIKAMAPAGGIIASAEDMSKWLQLWINAGTINNKRMVSARVIREALSPKISMGNGLPDRSQPDMYFSDYGYAWMLSSYKGHYRAEHGGNIDGFSASLCFFPSDSLGISVLCNADNSQLPAVVRNILSDYFLGLSETDWNTRLLNVQRQADGNGLRQVRDLYDICKTANPVSRKLSAYTGTFLHPAFGNAIIENRQDSLFMKTSLTEMWLKHCNYDVFIPVLRNPFTNKFDSTDIIEASLTVQFISDNKGNITGFESAMEPSLPPLLFQRSSTSTGISADMLELYKGEYKVPGTEVVMSILTGQSKLILQLPDQPQRELSAIGEGKFQIIGLSGFYVQFEKKENKISGLLLIQPQGSVRFIRL